MKAVIVMPSPEAKAGRVKTYIHFKEAPFHPTDPLLARIVAACREIEDLAENRCLDIEFCCQ
jgi:hypothetical protein